MKQLRERVGLRTVDVASRMVIAEGTIRNWEKGRTIPTLAPRQMLELCNLYACSLQELADAVDASRSTAND
jgi:DNA-binding transcriptional regulator YiaG